VSGGRLATRGDLERRWQAYWANLDDVASLGARELIELSPRLVDLFSLFLWGTQDDADGMWLDWEAAAKYVEGGIGLSSGERRLASVVLGLTADRPVRLRDLGYEGSWTDAMWSVLVRWGTNGRLDVTATEEQS
jgi:hypothetical protein